MLKIILSGCNGYMGRVVTDLVEKDPAITIVAGIDINTQKQGSYPVFACPGDIAKTDLQADAIIDFSIPGSLDGLLEFSKSTKTPIILCATGYSAGQIADIEKAAEQIWDAMSSFAAYAFNKPHAVGYAVVSYQTAWLKCYYPVEFMAATMTSVMDSSDKVSGYIRELKKMNIPLLPPDVNEGFAAFSVTEGNIRFGLSSIKNAGRGTIDALVYEREKNGRYKGLSDFIRRLSSYDINKRCLESLIRAGAFDSLGGKRSQYIAVYAGIQNGLTQTKKTTLSGQLSLFDLDDAPAEENNGADELPNIAEFPKKLLLQDEKELLGVYVSGHPLAEYEGVLNLHANVTSIDLAFEESGDGEAEGKTGNIDGQVIKYGGIITGKSIKYTKADNKPFAFLTVEDMYGAVEVIVFSKIYEKVGHRLREEQVLIIQGRVSVREDEASKIVAQDMLFYEDIPESISASASPDTTPVSQPLTTFWVKIPKTISVELRNIINTLASYPGSTRVMIYNEAQNKKFLANREYWVSPSDSLVSAMESLVGSGSVKITAK